VLSQRVQLPGTANTNTGLFATGMDVRRSRRRHVLYQSTGPTYTHRRRAAARTRHLTSFRQQTCGSYQAENPYGSRSRIVKVHCGGTTCDTNMNGRI